MPIEPQPGLARNTTTFKGRKRVLFGGSRLPQTTASRMRLQPTDMQPTQSAPTHYSVPSVKWNRETLRDHSLLHLSNTRSKTAQTTRTIFQPSRPIDSVSS